ncbi:hypothetical protein MZTS_21215 [Methylorubrum zatmanii]|nr:hypothetical protein [Methylorubrum zatmanii]
MNGLTSTRRPLRSCTVTCHSDQSSRSARLLITQDQLTAAHRKVGRMTEDIAAELGKKR